MPEQEQKLNEDNVSLLKYIDLRFDLAEKALELSKTEIDRRLETLNHLRSEVEKDRSTFLRCDVYERDHKDYLSFKSMVSEKVTTLETRSITWTAAIGIFFTILTLVISFLKLR